MPVHADSSRQVAPRDLSHLLCKPEVTGSIPVRSIEKGPAKRGFSVLQPDTVDHSNRVRLWVDLWEPETRD
jgi:hypothetical protein